jgi:restriction system protein
MENRVWVVRCSDFDADHIKNKKSIFIGWTEIDDLKKYRMDDEDKTREKIKAALREKYAQDGEITEGWIKISAGQLYRFAFEIKNEDVVLTPIKGTDTILIGKIRGEYEYVSNGEYPHIRKVDWIKGISRGDLSVPARNSTGAISTVFSLDEHLDEIKNIMEGKTIEISPNEEVEEIAQFLGDTEAKARGLIVDMLNVLDGYEFQSIVAAVLRARGYRTEESPIGRDEGVDIVAYSDDIGLAPIKIQVKHRKGAMSGPEVRSFIGTLQRGDKGGLYISTGGFTTPAQKAVRGHVIRLLNVEDFVDWLLESYEKLEPEFKAMVPLKKIYMPR